MKLVFELLLLVRILVSYVDSMLVLWGICRRFYVATLKIWGLVRVYTLRGKCCFSYPSDTKKPTTFYSVGFYVYSHLAGTNGNTLISLGGLSTLILLDVGSMRNFHDKNYPDCEVQSPAMHDL
jgi:hypothetical protein